MIKKILILLVLLWAGVAHAQQLAFPTAEGFGRFATGGRGGTAIHVTNLDASGAGSFRACAEASGARTCIFDVAGTIDLGPNVLYITNGDLTIAAHTAPGDGVLIKGGMIIVQASNVVIRFLRVRPGDPGADLNYSWQALSVINVSSQISNVIVDHCSVGWATDDQVGITNAIDITYQWCVISNGLYVFSNQGGGQFLSPKGGLIEWGVTRVSWLHNLVANFNDRAPYVQSGYYQAVNNLIYNVDGNANIAPIWSGVRAEFLANYWRQGPTPDYANSTSIRNLGPCWSGCGWLDAGNVNATSIYPKNEFHNTLRPTDTGAEDSHVFQGGQPPNPSYPTESSPFNIAGETIMPIIPSLTTAVQARTDILASTGAGAIKPAGRDAIDQFVVDNVTNVTGSTAITDPSQASGYPTITFVERAAGYDTDADGMPDSWETPRGLNPNLASDGATTLGNGYSNLENYLNEVAGDITQLPVVAASGNGTNSTTTIDITWTNNTYPPLTNIDNTKFACTENGTPLTETGTVVVGTNITRTTVSETMSAGTTIACTVSADAVQGAYCATCAYGPSSAAQGSVSITNNIAGGGSYVFTQKYFRIHGLRGTEAAPQVLPYAAAADNTNVKGIPGARFRVRLKVACTTADCPAIGMSLRYSLNGGAYTAVPDTFGADNIRFYGTGDTSSDIPTQATATTELLTSDHVTNVACAIERTSAAVPNVDLSQNSETECEYVVELDTDVAADATYDFRLYNQDGTALNTYTVTPRLTVMASQASGGF